MAFGDADVLGGDCGASLAARLRIAVDPLESVEAADPRGQQPHAHGDVGADGGADPRPPAIVVGRAPGDAVEEAGLILGKVVVDEAAVVMVEVAAGDVEVDERRPGKHDSVRA
jgi:hypothetical protein